MVHFSILWVCFSVYILFFLADNSEYLINWWHFENLSNGFRHWCLQAGIPDRALDIGCAVGRSTFELARVMGEAVGIDYSQSFVDACNKLKEDGAMDYTITTEGDLYSELKAVVSPDIVRTNQQEHWLQLKDITGKSFYLCFRSGCF